MLSLAVADFDGDSLVDLAAGSWEKQFVLEPSCTPVQVYAHAKPRMITVDDETSIEIAISGLSASTPVDERGTVSIGEDTATPDANGRAALNVSGLPLGEHEITVDYSGNGPLPAATGTATVVVVEEAAEVVITTSAHPPVYGSPWEIEVTVPYSQGFNLSPYFVSVDGGTETRYEKEHGPITFDLLVPGPHTIRARYAGSDDHPPGATEISVTVAKATPRLRLNAPNNNTTTRAGTAHVLDFTVSRPSGSSSSMETPSGVLHAYEGETLLASEPVDGWITMPFPALPRGAHDVRIVYSGDAHYESAEQLLTLHVLPDQPLAIEARALPAGMHIAYVAPSGAGDLSLFRRVAETSAWMPVNGWNASLGTDPDTLARGVVYEYILHTAAMASNIDGAMLFHDDILTVGTAVKLLHFEELRTAINEQRSLAGLTPFAFDATFGASLPIRASHVNGLRNAIQQARSALGMSTVTFTPIAPGSKILAADIQQLRDLAR